MRSCWLWLGIALALGGCASSSEPRPETTPDRTRDPELGSARAAAEPEFETQAEALAAGVYEPFVHPDSVGRVVPRPEAGGEAMVEPTTPRERGDPSTDELLGTLGAGDQYNQGGDEVRRGVSAVRPESAPGVWTLQTGAFSSETGALVRKRELEARFPDLPVWHVRGRDGLLRVYAGSFADRSAAERALERLAAGGYPDAWVARAP